MELQFKNADGEEITEVSLGEINVNDTSAILELALYNPNAFAIGVSLEITDIESANVSLKLSKTEDPFTDSTELLFNDVAAETSVSFFIQLEVLADASDGSGSIELTGGDFAPAEGEEVMDDIQVYSITWAEVV